MEVGHTAKVQYETVNEKLYANAFWRDWAGYYHNTKQSLNSIFAILFVTLCGKIESIILKVSFLNHEETSSNWPETIRGIMVRLRTRFGKYICRL